MVIKLIIVDRVTNGLEKKLCKETEYGKQAGAKLSQLTILRLILCKNIWVY